MNLMPNRWSGTAYAVAVLILASTPLAAQAPQAPPAATTAVLVGLTIKPDADRTQIPKVMPEEVRATVRLYLDGKIQQWYARGDGRGVVFILNVTTVAEAQALMDALPLAKANLATFDYTALTPLTPLRLLLAEPPTAPKGQPDR